MTSVVEWLAPLSEETLKEQAERLQDSGILPLRVIGGELLRLKGGVRENLLSTAQQHIHEKLIEKAKQQLSTTDLSVSEIAYQLGFEHSQSFSKLFKSKTNQSPLAFRQAFN